MLGPSGVSIDPGTDAYHHNILVVRTPDVTSMVAAVTFMGEILRGFIMGDWEEECLFYIWTRLKELSEL